MTLSGDLLNLPLDITFTRLRAVRREGVNEHGRQQLSRARFTACHLPWTDDGDCACLSPGEWTQTGDTGTRGKEQAPAATTKSAGAKRRCPAECRQLYRRHGESGAAGTVAASAAVDPDLRHQTLAVRPETACGFGGAYRVFSRLAECGSTTGQCSWPGAEGVQYGCAFKAFKG